MSATKYYSQSPQSLEGIIPISGTLQYQKLVNNCVELSGNKMIEYSLFVSISLMFRQKPSLLFLKGKVRNFGLQSCCRIT